jgi:hypothetical protein
MHKTWRREVYKGTVNQYFVKLSCGFAAEMTQKEGV